MPALVIQLALEKPRARLTMRRRLTDWAENATRSSALASWRIDTDEAPTYWNLNVETADLPRCWASLAPFLPGLRRRAATTIIVAEGAHGWDDYLLLFHSDRGETLDRLQ